eukprot:3936936-Rhodomonas_salina.1
MQRHAQSAHVQNVPLCALRARDAQGARAAHQEPDPGHAHALPVGGRAAAADGQPDAAADQHPGAAAQHRHDAAAGAGQTLLVLRCARAERAPRAAVHAVFHAAQGHAAAEVPPLHPLRQAAVHALPERPVHRARGPRG